MDFNTMTAEELSAKLEEIRASIQASEDIEELRSLDVDQKAILEELEKRKNEAAEKAEIRARVAAGAGVVTETIEPEVRAEEKTMEEIRNSAEYINAYANYIKTEDPTECRALLSENGSGTIPVPELVYDIVKTAWEREGIMSRVRKAYIRGNLKVGFEISSSEAALHTEGVAVDEESLVLGTVNLIPQSIKKWISISDEAMDLSGEAFLRYIYDELAYRIAKKAADTLVAQIIACGTVSTTTCPGVPAITEATVGVGTIAKAMAALSDEAANPVAMMNKLTWGALKNAQAGASYAYDPFEGIPVVFNNTIKAYSAASTGDTYIIVGDLGHGALANFPNGEEITFKYDEMTLATQDLVRVIGREFVALGVVAPDAFVKVKK